MAGERPDIAQKLVELGWGQPRKNPEVLVYQQYCTNKKINPDKPWEITVYHKLPCWRWDFVIPVRLGRPVDAPAEFIEHKKDPYGTEWISNIRSDFEFESLDDLDAVAREIDEELTDMFDTARLDDTFLEIAVQRVTDRPNFDTLEE